MDDGLTDLLHRITAIFGDVMRHRHAAGETQLSYTHMRIIGTLEDTPNLTQHQLAQAVGLSDSAASRALRSLAADGLVKVDTDPSHARRRLVEATPSGLERFHTAGSGLANELQSWLKAQGFPYEEYLQQTHRLAALLTAARPSSSTRSNLRPDAADVDHARADDGM